MSDLEFASRIGRIPVYPAADGYALDEHVALLASNEAPFAPLAEVAEAAAKAAAGAHRYPDPSSTRLRQAISGVTGVPVDRIAIGNGSCDVLLAAGEAMLEPGREIVHAWPSFSIYPQLAALSGADAIPVPLDGEARHDADALIGAISDRTALVVICNPNNPTGTLLPLPDVERILDAVPDSACVVLDEAYREFVTSEPVDATLPLLADHPNLLILRTFSKVYGLAALRVGYGLCGDSELRTAVDQVRQPFFCNVAAQAAAVEALRHPDAIASRVGHVGDERDRLADRLAGLGLASADSEANFLWVKLPAGADEASIVKGLAEREILVRAGTALGDPGHLRITVGLPEQHDRLIAALDGLLPGR